jgi:hypothetical protein
MGRLGLPFRHGAPALAPLCEIGVPPTGDRGSPTHYGRSAASQEETAARSVRSGGWYSPTASGHSAARVTLGLQFARRVSRASAVTSRPPSGTSAYIASPQRALGLCRRSAVSPEAGPPGGRTRHPNAPRALARPSSWAGACRPPRAGSGTPRRARPRVQHSPAGGHVKDLNTQFSVDTYGHRPGGRAEAIGARLLAQPYLPPLRCGRQTPRAGPRAKPGRRQQTDRRQRRIRQAPAVRPPWIQRGRQHRSQRARWDGAAGRSS